MHFHKGMQMQSSISSACPIIDPQNEGVDFEELKRNLKRVATLLEIGKILSKLAPCDFVKLRNRAIIIKKNLPLKTFRTCMIFPSNQNFVVIQKEYQCYIHQKMVEIYSQLGIIGRSLTIESTPKDLKKYAVFIHPQKINQTKGIVKLCNQDSKNTGCYFEISRLEKDIESQMFHLLDTFIEEKVESITIICLKTISEKA